MGEAAREMKKAREQGSFGALIAGLVASTIIVGGSWAVYAWADPEASLFWFTAVWAFALLMVKLSEGILPEVESDITKYYSFNPFNFEDDRNRRVLHAHVALYLPRIVLGTIRQTVALFSAPR